jgi:5-methylcytosine-specific restriction endonuclease McrA
MMRKQTSETRRKISLALKGRKKPIRSKEHCDSLSHGLMGRVAWNKGRYGYLSLEMRKKISETLKRKGIKPPSRKGIKLSEGHKEVLRNVWVNRKRTRKNRINSSLGARKRVAEGKHNFYKGGLVLIKEQIRDCIQYKLWLEDVFERDNYTCQKCNQRGGCLEADHIIGLAEMILLYNIKTLDNALNCPAIWDIDNGRTLCKVCHKETYNYGRREAIRLYYLYGNS